MKKHRKIIIKNPSLKKIRNNFRKIIQKAKSDEINNIIKKQRELLNQMKKEGKLIPELEEKSKILESRKQTLNRVFNESICICPICREIDKDMVYATRSKAWYCIDCYETKLPKRLQEKWEPKYPLTKEQVLEFLDELKKVIEQCQTNLDLSKEILSGMDISKNDQKIFLETLYHYGGHCDCEIMLNAYPKIMADFDLEMD